MDFKISFAITACNEHEELQELLAFVLEHKRGDDEVVVQCDLDNTTPEVQGTLKAFGEMVETVAYFPLNKDFATYKNNLKSLCQGDYVFQLDADELPSLELVENLHLLLEANPDVDLFGVPRINIVEGLEQEHLKKWKWELNEREWVNWPDYQSRLFKNTFNIKWINKVHEVISGHSSMAQLPPEEKFSILHHKNIEKQEAQNSFYSQIT